MGVSFHTSGRIRHLGTRILYIVVLSVSRLTHAYNATEHAPRVNTSASGQSAHQNAHNQQRMDRFGLSTKRKTLTKKEKQWIFAPAKTKGTPILRQH
ncbi:hypothetical protein FJTKL_06226 [Diaporthe vaccinii]|uniref:Secreted protein n=1 Tax=Diaporthe vaccinii TaxID=105482 RepID=A0ABR4DU44_9PEZI